MTIARYAILSLLIGFTHISNAQNLIYSWSHQLGGVSHDITSALASSDDGDVFSTGYFQDTLHTVMPAGQSLHVSEGFTDIFVTRHNAAGEPQWVKRIGNEQSNQPLCIAIDEDKNVLIGGIFRDTMDADPGVGVSYLYPYAGSSGQEGFIILLDSNGVFQWGRSVGAVSNDYVQSVAFDPDGYIYAVGSFRSTVDFNPGAGTFNLTSPLGYADGYALKLTGNGDFVKAIQFTGNYMEGADVVTVDEDFHVLISGHFRGEVDLDPGASQQLVTPVGNSDVFVVRLDSSLSLDWAETFGGPGWDYPNDILVDDQNNVYTAGYFQDSVDFDPSGSVAMHTSAGSNDGFVVRLDDSGDFSWVTTVGSSNTEFVNGIDINDSHDLAIAGRFGGTASFGGNGTGASVSATGSDDGFYAILDTSGAIVTAQNIGGSSSDIALDCSINNNEQLSVAGAFNNTIDLSMGLGIGEHTSEGAQDAYVLFLEPCQGIFTTDSVISCSLEYSPVGSTKVWDSNGIYFDTLSAVNTCDSIVQVYLTISPLTGSLVAEECHSTYYLPSGTPVTLSGIYHDTLQTAQGCDSIVTIDLSFIDLSTEESVEVCESTYELPWGTVIDSTGVYADTLVSAEGCDSVSTINVTFIEVDTAISKNGFELNVWSGADAIQWIYCSAGDSLLSGETGPAYTAAQNGSYAAILEYEGCVDTTRCVDISGVGLEALDQRFDYHLYPNPTNAGFFVSLSNAGQVEMCIRDITGAMVEKRLLTKQKTFVSHELPAGVYTVELIQDNAAYSLKLIVH